MVKLTRPVENGLTFPSAPVKSNIGSEKGPAESYPLTPATRFCLSTAELRKVVDSAYSEAWTEVHMSDSSQTVSEVYDGMTATTEECQDSMPSIGMSSAFLQFNPSLMSTATSHREGEPKIFHHILRDLLDQFGLNSLEVETKKSLVTMVNSFNVRCSDPLPAVVGLGLVHAEAVEDKHMPTQQMDRIHTSVKLSNRRRKKSGTVLCLMPLPEGGFGGDQDLLTVRSAPTVLQGAIPMPARRGNSVQRASSQSAYSNSFGLGPVDPFRYEQQPIISTHDNIANSNITVASEQSMSSSTGRSQTSGSSAASGVRPRTMQMAQKLSQEQGSPRRSKPTATPAARGVPLRSLPGIQRLSDERLSPISKSSRHAVGPPLGVGRVNRFDNAEMPMRRGASDRGFERFEHGAPTSPMPEKKELKKFFNAIFKHQLQHSLTPEMLLAMSDHGATNSRIVDTELTGSTHSSGSNRSGFPGQFR